MTKVNDLFDILRKIDKKPGLTQRQLAQNLGFSLGKINYCIKALRNKSYIKILNLKKKKNKIEYVKKYVLTKKGLKFRIQLTIKFMKKKLQEYDSLKEEINEINEIKN